MFQNVYLGPKKRRLHLNERPLFVLFVMQTFITNLRRKDAFMIIDY